MDPDVEAAFGGGPAAPSQASAPVSDPDVSVAFGGQGTKVAPPWLVQSDKPIEADATPWGSAVGLVNKWAGGKLASGAQALGMTDPNSLRDIRNLPAAVEAVGVPYAAGKFGPSPPGVNATSHPLAEAATAEQSRLDAMNAKASAAGFDIGNRTISQPNQIVNHLGRQDLGLPTMAADGVQAPLTPNMLHAANKQYVSPAYQAVEQYPKPIALSDTTQATLADVKPLLTPKEVATLPSGDTATGQQVVTLSKALRAKANQFPDYGVNASNQTWSSISQAHMDAARSLEDDARTQFASDGNEQLADAWDAARVYRAKSAAYEHSLDGAGNIKATDLKNQLVKQGVPLTDNAELIANVAAQAPELFKGGPQAPQPGLVRQGVASALPWAGAAIGAHVAGPGGAIAGEVLGKRLGQKLAPP